MGQCMSRKAAGAFAASAAVSHNRPTKMQKHHQLKSPDDDNNKKSPTGDQPPSRKPPACSKGVAMSFGFKRRPTTAPSIASNSTAARRLANADVIDRIDRNGNENGGDSDMDALTSNAAPTGRSTPRLAPPKKEANATQRVSRFGFRHNQANRLNKVADLNSAPAEFGYKKLTSPVQEDYPVNGNNNPRRPSATINRNVMDNNRNSKMKVAGLQQPQIGKFTLQSTHLPRPEPIRVIETKTAKTLANNNRRIAGMYHHHHEETSSKDGSLTEDSGVGSHLSGYIGDDIVPELERLDGSPTFGVRRNSQQKPRNLDVVKTGNNKFDVRDLDDSNDSTESCAPPPLPHLPSAFNTQTQNKRGPYQNTGLVRERTLEYELNLNWDNRGRKISVTSSEGFSDDYGENEKSFKDRFKSEKLFIKSTPHKTFLKSRTVEVKEADSSPPSSDEHEWVHGGEAMADDISFCMSSSDESRDKKGEDSENLSVPISAAVIGTALQSLMSTSLSTSFTNSKDVKNVLLSIEDPKFAAVAAASNLGSLLDDELLSPVESLISCSESEEILKRRLTRSSSNSKDINEKLTPPSPGTPSNATNSLSLSDGKDDFLIDDEIADQPALVFEKTMTVNNSVPNDNFSLSQNNSENTPTIVDSTPKPKRRILKALEGSPLSLGRNKAYLHSRTGSLDTLSPCESIASDDLMMDYDYSQSSGLDDCDRRGGEYSSLNETLVRFDADNSKSVKDCWTYNSASNEKCFKSTPSRSRLLNRSRTATPNSIPDSPRSLDSRVNRSTRPAATSSPIRSRFSHVAQNGYESDDSVRFDRTNHTAMKQDIMSIKTMLLKLRRVLNESETHNPFESQILTNGLFNSLCPSNSDIAQNGDNMNEARVELAELRRQVLFLQGQLEDKEKTVQSLQEQMVQLVNDNYHANSAPASTVASDLHSMCNAATQTDRIRPISAGPSLLNGSSIDGSAGSLVSASESPSHQRRSRPPCQQQSESPSSASKRTPSRLWRQPGEPPSPPRYAGASSIPRRANSRTRMPASTPS